MEIRIRNIAKIHSADIKLNGITVIAGKNNTGKSTAGELLGVFFSTMCDRNQKNTDARIRHMKSSIYDIFRDSRALWSGMRLRRLSTLKLEECFLEKKDFDFLLENFPDEFKAVLDYEKTESLRTSFNEVSAITDKQIEKEAINNNFKDVMGEVNSQFVDCRGSVDYIIKNENNSLLFNENQLVECNTPTAVSNTATYIRDPFELDCINTFYPSPSCLQQDLYNKLRGGEETENSNPVTKILNKNLLEKVYEQLNTVVPGSFITENGELKYSDGSLKLKVESLSTGLKSFAIIKRLIEQGAIREKDVLILDEPEIHLHPEWQLVYAELIVILQKTLNLTVLLTTHSSTFLKAIDLFSKKHEISQNCNYYVAKPSVNEIRMTDFEDVTGELEKIYKELVTPVMALVDLEESLENQQRNV